MEKQLDTYKCYEECVKENLVFFQSFYYHSILDLNLVKMAKILEDGLVTRKNLKAPCLYTESLNSYECKNGDNSISVSSCIGKFPLNNIFHAFAVHVLSSPSIMINKSISTQKEVQNGYIFDDELFVLNGICKENFKGILLPEHLMSKQICEINPVVYNAVCLKKQYINMWIALIEKYFNTKIDRNKLMIMVDELNNFGKKYYEKHCTSNQVATNALAEQKVFNGHDLKEAMALILQELWDKKLNSENVSYIDVLSYINKDKLPIYELSRKRVIKKSKQK